MRTRPRRAAATVLVLAALVTGCGDDEEPVETADPAGGTAVDVPGSPVLPDRLSVSEDGTEVLADCWEGICRWDTSDGALAGVDDGSHLAISPDWTLIAGADGPTVVLAEPDTGDVVAELTGLDDEEATDGSPVQPLVQAVAFSPDGELVAAAGPGGQVLVWTAAGEEVATIGAGAEVFALAFDPDGRRLATAGGGPVEVYDVPAGDLVGTLPRSSGDGDGLAWSPDGRWLAGPGPGGAPTVWSAGDLAVAAVLDDRFLEQVAYSPDSRTLALTDTEDDTVRLWDPTADDDVRELVGHVDDPVAVAFSPDGGTLYSASGRGVLAWDTRSASLDQELQVPE